MLKGIERIIKMDGLGKAQHSKQSVASEVQCSAVQGRWLSDNKAMQSVCNSSHMKYQNDQFTNTMQLKFEMYS